jgi:uncharacterized small protein (DUF1192 family)
MTITANDLRKIADAMDAAAVSQQEIAFLKSEVTRLRADRNQWKAKAIAAEWGKPSSKTAKASIPNEIKKKLISCVHPDHCSSIHAHSVSQWLLAQ